MNSIHLFNLPLLITYQISQDDKSVPFLANKVNENENINEKSDESLVVIIKKLIITCEVEIIDVDVEHFGKWIELAKKFLESEIERLKLV